MKKIVMFIFGFLLVLSNYAVELHPEEECFSMKTNLTAQVGKLQQQNSDLRFSNNFILNSRVPLLYGSIEAGRSNDTAGDNIGDFNQMQIIANGISNTSYQTSLTLETQYNQIQSVFSAISSIDCTACSVSSTNCCDFTEILQAIGEVNDSVDTSVYVLSVISNQLNDLEYTNFLLEHGFGDTTNILSSIQGVVTNLVKNPNNYGATTGDRFTYIMYGGSLNANQRDWWSNLRYSKSFSPMSYGYLKSLYDINYLNFLQLSSLNNFFYEFSFNRFPILTNTVGSIHRDITNFFSFFRGEIGVQGVLSDWQSEQVSGSYHDFLTNHYLTVVQGGPLSGNQSNKTNWFSRIETLLAALVFTDTTTTNTVDSSVGESERSQISSAYMGANSAASSVSDDLKTTTRGIVELYRSYFETFDNAAMPSHVVLMRLQGQNGEEDVEISFESDSLSILVEGCRIVTTLCWASVGIFLLYKFLVWSARCVIVACQFIYRAISSVFKS